MTEELQNERLTAEAFTEFGDVTEAEERPDQIINQGACGRFHGRASMDFGPDGCAGIVIFRAEPRRLPCQFDLLKRHPDGGQASTLMPTDPFWGWCKSRRILAQDTIYGSVMARKYKRP